MFLESLWKEYHGSGSFLQPRRDETVTLVTLRPRIKDCAQAVGGQLFYWVGIDIPPLSVRTH